MTHPFRHIIFDLDGTLTDSSEGIINSILYALEKLNITEDHPEELTCFIGPPLIDSMINRYGLSVEESKEAVSHYRTYFSSKGVFENRLYDRAYELLEVLSDRGKKICLATSKPDKYVDVILKHFSIDHFFDAISAASIEKNILHKTAVLRELFMQDQGIDKKGAVMIGDRSYDMIGAHKNGLPAIGVLWGFGSENELTTENPYKIVSTFSELEKVLI